MSFEWNTGTHLTDVCTLDGEVEWHVEEDFDELCADEDCLQFFERRAR
jgi:hypothetical protein